ncbi:RIP metalloprotease RseP [Porticoccus sp. W117]|uniref:RIP metalloprotease RseP n=1 Tax=Porticoccus sp. W117 TaxID=3054777 RepID=UPI002596F949|nr:RIP metalloprotease RseP [Porticoccus sp. W117]MDM3870269.1 RIP metalloprotease RseP [Porticoccus sp. W117]
MEVAKTIFYAILALGVLVSFHEFGHFWVARRCGIKVLRFSIGFGKPIVTWTDKLGTEYAIAWIPLGGYVRMVDEREDDVAPEDLPYAFNRKPVWQRIAVVVAGPAANFLLAIFFYWIIAMQGVVGVAAIVGQVAPGSIADRAGLQPGLEILSVDGVQTPTQQSFHEQLILRLGDTSNITFSASPTGSEEVYTYTTPLGEWEVDSKKPDLLKAIGLDLSLPEFEAEVGSVESDSPADVAGLESGDRIVSADGESMENWQAWVNHIKPRAEQPIALIVERNGVQFPLTATPARVEVDGESIGRLGVGPLNRYWRLDKYGPLESVGRALNDTWDKSVLTLVTLKKLVTGRISAEHLSGPLGIAKVAGQTAEVGLVYYLGFLALLSVNLGVLNLLPIPVLDGGHLVYYIAEAIKGSPVSEKVQVIGYKIGLFLVMGLMIFAIGNDIRRELPDDSVVEQNISDQQ